MPSADSLSHEPFHRKPNRSTCNKSQDATTVIGVTNGPFLAKDNTVYLQTLKNVLIKCFRSGTICQNYDVLGNVRLHNSIYQRDIELRAAIFCLSAGSEFELDRRTVAQQGFGSTPVQFVSHNPL